MTIWILALVLLASLAALGYRQGAIRVVFSFAGIVFGGLLAAPLGEHFKPLMTHAGIHNPALAWMLGPLEAFALVLILFKIAGSFVHRKTELHYKYRADDLKFVLWERLNHRLGLCLGVLNGTAYFVLICFFLFNFSYWTAQIASSDAQTWATRLINRLGRDLESTGMNKAARTVATLPESYYKTADLAGLLCQNPQLGDRLARYPAFLSLLERDDLKQLAQDSTFTSAFQGGVPAGQLLHDPQMKAILQNVSLIETVWENLQTNMDDLIVYLKTGQSPKYDPERILGFWDFNATTTAAMLPIAQPKISPAEMKFARLWMTNYLQTTLVVASDHQAFLHNLPHLKSPPVGETATLHLWPIIVYRLRSGSLPNMETSTLTGQWENTDGDYKLSFTNNGKPDSLKIQIKNDRLTMTTSDGDTLVFDRED
ncbi:MAG: CvpA family protein [Verrucomicrobiota bacterium]